MLETLPIKFLPVVTQDESWTGPKHRITSYLGTGHLLPDLDPSKNKVMICGSLDFNQQVKDILLAWGWSEGNKRTAGTFVQERAFVER